MPFVETLTKQLTHLRRRQQALRRLRLSTKRMAPKTPTLLGLNFLKRHLLSSQPICAVASRKMGKNRSPAVLAIAVASLTGVMGHGFYNQPKLQVGTIAPQTIRAPFSDRIEDKQKTEANRTAARTKSQTVLMIDTTVNQQIDQNLQQALQQANDIRVTADAFPFAETFFLSISSQRYLRSCAEVEWQALLKTLATNTDTSTPGGSKQQKNRDIQDLIPNLELKTSYKLPGNQGENPEFNQALAQLQAYRLTTSHSSFASLLASITQVRQKYSLASAKLVEYKIAYPNSFLDSSILDLSDEDWVKTQAGIRTAATRILAQGLSPGLPRAVINDAVNLQVQSLVPKESETWASRLLLAVLKPNLKQDIAQTKQQAAQAAAAVTPVVVSVKRHQVIVRQGDKINTWQFELLDHYGLSRRGINWLGLLQLGGVVTGAVGIFAVMEGGVQTRLRERDRILVLLLALSTPLIVVTTGTPYSNWSALGLLLGSFYGSALAITVVGLLVVLLPISLKINGIGLIAGAAGGIVASWMAARMRSREELAILGIAIGLTQGGIYLLLSLLLSPAVNLIWYTVLGEAASFALSGLAWSIIALGFSPYLEQLFDLVTPIRLAELASPNRPLLQKLATEAPGTFQHTLFVATLAETAAKALRCNVELVRAGVLYHDIGKMHDPLGFIENQMGGPNKHDTEINNPWKSTEIIKNHVTQGLVMARKHRLPTAIQSFIPEHQGTMLIAYFYHQAQEMAKENPCIEVNEADFRYDGPIPQSRETGIVMLADSCEAALRSLKDASKEQALAMVNNILRARWQDNQLVDSGLTRDEMTKIAEIFVHVWQQFHHKRIAYPKLKTSN